MDLGTPCNLTTSLIYKGTKSEVEIVVFMGRKWATFVSLSITTQIASLPLEERGNPTTKSMVMFSNFHVGSAMVLVTLQAFDAQPLLSDKYHKKTHTWQYQPSSASTKNSTSNLDTS
jgi:hypothetical protein